MRNLILLTVVLLIGVFGYAQAGSAQSSAAGVPPTEISADLGTCSVLVNVTGADSKPVYNAKVTTRIRYGVMGVKKLDLETYTSANGQAKIVKLPEVPRKPLFIYITKGEAVESVEFKPDVRCNATFDVKLK
jgi:hypothetical protein